MSKYGAKSVRGVKISKIFFEKARIFRTTCTNENI